MGLCNDWQGLRYPLLLCFHSDSYPNMWVLKVLSCALFCTLGLHNQTDIITFSYRLQSDQPSTDAFSKAQAFLNLFFKYKFAFFCISEPNLKGMLTFNC